MFCEMVIRSWVGVGSVLLSFLNIVLKIGMMKVSMMMMVMSESVSIIIGYVMVDLMVDCSLWFFLKFIVSVFSVFLRNLLILLVWIMLIMIGGKFCGCFVSVLENELFILILVVIDVRIVFSFLFFV